VVLLDDCFTTYNAPEVGRAAVKVLEASGYQVELAGLTCCGRPAISKGLMGIAKELARENLARLAPLAREGVPIVGCEPSCLLTLVDEYRDLQLGKDATTVANAARLIDDFVADHERVPELALLGGENKILLHGHCQQKALVGTGGTLGALRRIPGLEIKELDSGCCGMAGSFGYELGHYEISKALAERVILPAVAAEPASTLVAPGFSCRCQVHGLAGILARHPIEVVAARLPSETSQGHRP
jgi:Fe-S oxidoreductase